MYKGKYGTYDGNSWEERIQECLKLKYDQEGYQELPASNGDLGIEGFTRTGKVFQCYCPEEDYDPQIWYEKQRDKVTNDLRKLTQENYIEKIKQYFQDIKIKEWHFLTPTIKKKDLVKHCHDKETEIRNKNLDHFDSGFRVLAKDEDFFKHEFEQLLGSANKLNINSDIEQSDIIEWQNSNDELIKRANRKNQCRINSSKPGLIKKINILTTTTIHDYLEMNSIISRLKEFSPERYELFNQIVSNYEKQVESMCAENEDSNVTLLQTIKEKLKEKLTENMKEFSEDMCDRLTNGQIAKWIFDCPIEFEYYDD